jgi:putative membrane protein insertion efficiency factor
LIRTLHQLPVQAAMAVIRLYQLILSPLVGPSCRFSPSCSHYGMQAFRHHGFLAGLWLTLARLARCHPWGGHGHDPVPDQFTWWRSRRHAQSDRWRSRRHAQSDRWRSAAPPVSGQPHDQ